MSRIAKVAKNTKTIAFPRTTRDVLDSDFTGTNLRFVVLNEGLEKFGECQDDRRDDFVKLFCGTFGRT